MRDLIPWARSRSPARDDDLFAPFRRDLDRMFDEFWRGLETRSFAPPTAATGVAWPSMDIEETDEAYKVTVELPGIDEKDVDLALRDNILTISGEKREQREEKAQGRHYAERVYGRFERTLPLPVEVDADKVKAETKNGVLTVTLPKNPKAQDKTRRIPISGASTAV